MILECSVNEKDIWDGKMQLPLALPTLLQRRDKYLYCFLFSKTLVKMSYIKF